MLCRIAYFGTATKSIDNLNTRPRGSVGFPCHVYLLRCCVLVTTLVDRVRSFGPFAPRRSTFQLTAGPTLQGAGSPRKIRRGSVGGYGDSPIQDQGRFWALAWYVTASHSAARGTRKGPDPSLWKGASRARVRGASLLRGSPRSRAYLRGASGARDHCARPA